MPERRPDPAPKQKQPEGDRLRIVWAMDDYYSADDLDRCCLDVLRALATRVRLDVIPVHVLEPSSLDLSVNFQVDRLKQMETEALELLSHRLEELRLKGIRAPRVLVHMPGVGPGPVQLLTGFAREIGADVLLSCTRARQGYHRFVTGSFSENLMIHSPLPVLLVSPRTRVGGNFEEIVFPTDFSPDSKVAFEGTIRLAGKLGARVAVFFQETADLAVRDVASAGEDLVDRAAAVGVDCVYHAATLLGPRLVAPADAILEYVESGHPERRRLIVMATHACPASPRLSTSVARQLVERSTRPVWVIHGCQSRGITAAAG